MDKTAEDAIAFSIELMRELSSQIATEAVKMAFELKQDHLTTEQVDHIKLKVSEKSEELMDDMIRKLKVTEPIGQPLYRHLYFSASRSKQYR